MTAVESHNAAAVPSDRCSPVTWLILAVLILLGAGLRFYQNTRVGLWPDEFWSSVYLATGRGSSVLDLPSGVLVSPPPLTQLPGAPHWWHIWTSLKSIIHPPLYLILLRWWMDIFGSGDASTRAFSAVASLAGVVVLFNIVRKTISTRAGLIAAGLMAISAAQIDLSQESRPYSLLILMSLLAADALFRIERRGPSPARLALLGLWAAATALTHYFSIGALLALFIYVVVRFRGKARRQTVAALIAAAVLVLVVWGPFFWQQRAEFSKQVYWTVDFSPRSAAVQRISALPVVYLQGDPGVRLSWIAPAIIAYLLPLVLLRRFPAALFWWLWIVGSVGSILVYDLVHHSRLLMFLKYTVIASPALYALCATPLVFLKKWRWIVAYLVLASVAIAAAERVQQGPSEANGDWRGLAVKLGEKAGPDDPLVFYLNTFWGSPGMYFLDFAHYVANSDRPIMYLWSPADASALRQLRGYKRVWLVGPDALMDGSHWLPGWDVKSDGSLPAAGSYAEMVPSQK